MDTERLRTLDVSIGAAIPLPRSNTPSPVHVTTGTSDDGLTVPRGSVHQLPPAGSDEQRGSYPDRPSAGTALRPGERSPNSSSTATVLGRRSISPAYVVRGPPSGTDHNPETEQIEAPANIPTPTMTLPLKDESVPEEKAQLSGKARRLEKRREFWKKRNELQAKQEEQLQDRYATIRALLAADRSQLTEITALIAPTVPQASASRSQKPASSKKASAKRK